MKLEDIGTLEYRERFVERFWSLVDRSGGSDSCWLWTGGTNSQGYGKVWAGGCPLRAHRVAFLLHHGEVDDSLQVCHACDTPACVNHRCLWQGTQVDNTRDMVRKGRYHRAGEKNPSAVLTDADVLDIRRRYAVGGISQRALAKEYGVAHSVINQTVHRKAWAHLPDEILEVA